MTEEKRPIRIVAGDQGKRESDVDFQERLFGPGRRRAEARRLKEELAARLARDKDPAEKDEPR